MARLAILVAGFVSLGGLVITVRAIFPKRRGETPFCHKCRYNLTGLDLGAPDARCPECGTPLRTEIRIGERRVRRGRLALGAVLFVIGAVPVAFFAVDAVRQSTWYAYAPTSWVLCDVDGGKRSVADCALREIRRRLAGGKMDSDDVTALIEVCLAAQTRPPLGFPVSDALVYLLDDPRIKPFISAEQFTQLWENSIRRMELIVPPRLVSGSQSPVGIRIEARMPVTCYLRCIPRELRVNGRSQAMGWPLQAGGSSGTATFTHSRDYRLEGSGAATIEVDVVVEGFKDWESRSAELADWQCTKTLRAETEFLPNSSTGAIERPRRRPRRSYGVALTDARHPE